VQKIEHEWGLRVAMYLQRIYLMYFFVTALKNKDATSETPSVATSVEKPGVPLL
jgi:hypothetical protein